jgi:DNA-directed RNA polymerase specialized sigma24 family protein
MPWREPASASPAWDGVAAIDADLDAAVTAGDFDRTMTLLWVTHGDDAVRIAIAVGVPEVDSCDVLQDVYQRLERGWATFDGRDIVQWFKQVVRYEARSHVKARVRQWRRVDPDTNAAATLCYVAPAADDRLEVGQTFQFIEAIAAELSPSDRAIYEGMKQGEPDHEIQARVEAATKTTISCAALRQRKCRLRSKFQDRLVRR